MNVKKVVELSDNSNFFTLYTGKEIPVKGDSRLMNKKGKLVQRPVSKWLKK